MSAVLATCGLNFLFILTYGTMKLINCTTLRVEDCFNSSTTRPYAILSHRWEADEVTYQDIIGSQPPTHKAGWTKIREACRVAQSRGYDFAWVDTCCINKQDFAELTEAINSMFKWYARAGVCIAYLSDVSPEQPSVEDSQWFTRGWTLPELIAPELVEFFDREWNKIGTRAELCDEIRRITDIDEKILRYDVSSGRTIEELLSEVPVARRMSWASGRATTREEDIAYSLLGIFGINMPLLYGEGSNAFMRLQLEIMKETNDMTLFAWTCSSGNPYQQGAPEFRGILASSPGEFEDTGNVVFTRDIKYNPEVSQSLQKITHTQHLERVQDRELTLEQYTMTNKGLRIETGYVVGEDRTHFLILRCKWDDGAPGQSLAIPLKDHGGGIFLRSDPDRLVTLPEDELRERKAPIYIKKHIRIVEEPPVYVGTERVLRKAYQFHTNGSKRVTIEKVMPKALWNHQRRMFVTEGLDSFEGFVQFRIPDAGSRNKSFIVACGFAAPDSDWICMASSYDDNVLLYNSAMEGDLNGLRRHASTARQVYNSEVTWELPSEAEVTVRTRLRTTERIFDIYVDAILQCLIM